MGSRIAVFVVTLIAIAVALGLTMQETPPRSASDPTIMTDAHFEHVAEVAASACRCKQEMADDECYDEYRRLTDLHPNVADRHACAPVADLWDCFETDSETQCVFRPHIVVGGDDFALCSQEEVDVYESHFGQASAQGVSPDDAAIIAAEAVRNGLPPAIGFSGCG